MLCIFYRCFFFFFLQTKGGSNLKILSVEIKILSCKEKKHLLSLSFQNHLKSKLLIHRGMSYRGANICSDNDSMLLWLFINENESNIRFKIRKRFGHYSYSVILLLFIIYVLFISQSDISVYIGSILYHCIELSLSDRTP